ncbi:MAG: MBL fold metallo-hydrolase [Chitinophagales bacterium]
MMKLHVINSNSKGNCYFLKDSSGKMLLLECGVILQKIKEAVNFDLQNIVGCILTHEHGDHAKSAEPLSVFGVNIYTSPGTINALGFQSRRLKPIPEQVEQEIGPFVVKPFNVKHDAAQPYGFLINHKEMGTTMFMTDTYYCEYNFGGLNNIIIEANYCENIINEKLANAETTGFVRDRVIQSHMSLQTCINTLQAYDLTKVNNIVVIHLSDNNSDENLFYNEIKNATGKTVTIAVKGKIINLGKTPF